MGTDEGQRGQVFVQKLSMNTCIAPNVHSLAVADTAVFKHATAELHVSFQQSHAITFKITLSYHENEDISEIDGSQQINKFWNGLWVSYQLSKSKIVTNYHEIVLTYTRFSCLYVKLKIIWKAQIFNQVICKFILLSSSTNIQFCKTCFNYELQQIHFYFLFSNSHSNSFIWLKGIWVRSISSSAVRCSGKRPHKKTERNEREREKNISVFKLCLFSPSHSTLFISCV